jgi:hydrogenase maturation protease
MNEWEFRVLEDKSVVDSIEIEGVAVRPGDHVRLRPRAGHDVLDIALAGKIATVESIEQDYEGKFHLAVIVNEDPGRDLGTERQPGHRFFFAPSEVEPVADGGAESANSTHAPRILVAGIGNIFLGDDAFGVEVAAALAQRRLPESVRVVDFGIRGFDLAYALLDGYEVTILVDACPRGDAPGTLYVVEPDVETVDASEPMRAVETHGMNPMNVIRLAKTMEKKMSRVLLVGCEPQELGGEEGAMGLSEPIAAAVIPAADLVESLVNKIINGESLEGASNPGQ